MVQAFVSRLPYIVAAILVFFMFYIAAKGIRMLVRKLSWQRKRHRNVGLVMGRLAQGLIILVGLLVAFVIALPAFRPTQMLEFLGIGTVAIGFAFRDVFQNYLAGIILLLTEPFRIDDQIRVAGFEGTVEDVQTRATTIRTYDGRRVVIPNADLITESVVVHTAYQNRRLEFDFGIGYGDDIDRAKRLALEAIRANPNVLHEPAPDVLAVGLADSSVTLRARWWIQPPRRADALDARDEVISHIKEHLLSNGVDLPFQTTHVLFHDQTEESDGDRARQREGWPAGSDRVPGSFSLASAVRELAHSLQTARK